MKIDKLFKHFFLITKHRYKVFVLCTKSGLFWRGLVHDLSKYSPEEFFEGVKYYSGNCSPISLCRIDKGYSKAWLHHKGRNKHHIEYWYDEQNAEPINIPYQYAVECVCDMIVAAKIYRKKDYSTADVLTYWTKHRNFYKTNERIKYFFDRVFTDLKEQGEKYVVNKKYFKKTYNEIVNAQNLDKAL